MPTHASIASLRLPGLLKERALWVLILLGVLYFHRPLFLNETLYFRDLYLHDLSEKQLLVDFLKAGELPLWDPYQNGGRPYLANVIYFPLYPFNLLYLFLPLVTAFNLTIIGHCLACCVGAYVCARKLGLQPAASFLTGAVYGFGGYMLSLTNILNRILAMPYIPLLCLCWHVWLLERKKRWFVASVLAGVAQVLAGAPETTLLTVGLILGWSLVYPYPHGKIVRRILLWGLLMLCILGISAVQILPMLEVISQSHRGEGLEYASFVAWSLSPKRLPEFILPNFLGYPEMITAETYYWGAVLEDEGFPYIISIYVGLVALILGLIGMLCGGTPVARIGLPRRVRWFLGLISALAFGLSFGHYWPFFRWGYDSLPLITVFRYPIKFLMAGLFPFALLAGIGSECHFGTNALVPSRRLVLLFYTAAALIGGFTLMFAWSDRMAHGILGFFFAQPGHTLARHTLTQAMLHLLIMWCGVTLLYQHRCLQRYAWQPALLAGMVAIDLLVAAQHVNFYAPAELFAYTPPVVPLIVRELGDGRLYRHEAPVRIQLQIPEDNALLDSEDKAWGALWNINVLNYYLAVFYHIPVIYHRDIPELSPVRVSKLHELLATLPWEQRLPLLSAGAVTLVLTSDAVELPELPKIAEIPNYSDLPLYLYRNLSAAGRIEFITTWTIMSDEAATVHAMIQSGFDPRREVMIHPPDRLLFESNLPDSTPERPNTDTDCASDAQITVGASASDFAEYMVSNACAGYLVFSEIFYPGWRVLVDGERVPLRRANLIFSAVYLEPGSHTIRREYRPNSLRLGLWCSGASLLGLSCFAGWPVKRRI